MATWTIYIRSGTKTAKNSVFSNPQFFRETDFKIAVELASKAVSRYANWNFEIVNDRSKSNIEICSHNPATWSPMYLGNYNHASGIWDQKSKTVVIHDGWIPKKMSEYGVGYWWNFTSGSVSSLAGLILHEIGHHNSLIGHTHKMNMTHLMRDDPPSNLLSLVQRKFGKSKRTYKANINFSWEPLRGKQTFTLLNSDGIVQRTKLPPTAKNILVKNLQEDIYTAKVSTTDGDIAESTVNVDLHKNLSYDFRIKSNINPWHNYEISQDVNDDGVVSGLDALAIINKLNRREDLKDGDIFYDVNKDKKVTISDALAIIKYMNRNR